jgi:hypothetical protein
MTFYRLEPTRGALAWTFLAALGAEGLAVLAAAGFETLVAFFVASFCFCFSLNALQAQKQS